MLSGFFNRPLRALPAAAALVFGLMAAASSFAQPAAAPDSAQALDLRAIDVFISQCVASYRIPGLSFALVEDGRTVFLKGYGEAARGQAATADTRYIIGSTSKMFTALAVLRLVEEGKVELDAPYTRYVPQFELATPGAAEKITVRHLLTMVSGLTDKGLAPLAAGKASPEAELARLRKGVLSAEPGSYYHYYTVNYRLLAILIERVSGRGIEEYIEGEVFAPVGMTSSRVGLCESGGSGALPRSSIAQGYGVFLGLPVPRRQEIRVSAFASGMIVSTAHDIGKYLEAEIAVNEGGAAIGAVSARSLAASWSAPSGVRFNPWEDLGDGTSYGMGWMILDGGKGSGVSLFHAGALENYQSAFFLDPGHRRGFAILMNQGGISAQTSINAVRDGLFSFFDGKEPGPMPGRPTVIIFAVILALAIAFSAIRILRLRAWRKRAARRSEGRGRPAPRDWIVAAIELAAALALVFGLIPAGNAIMGDYTDWVMIYGMAPDAMCALPVILAGALIVAAYKARALTGLSPKRTQTPVSSLD